jgi:hypothetical protein
MTARDRKWPDAAFETRFVSVKKIITKTLNLEKANLWPFTNVGFLCIVLAADSAMGWLMDGFDRRAAAAAAAAAAHAIVVKLRS